MQVANSYGRCGVFSKNVPNVHGNHKKGDNYV